MTLAALIIFPAAFGIALYAIASTVGPYAGRIWDALNGIPQSEIVK